LGDVQQDVTKERFPVTVPKPLGQIHHTPPEIRQIFRSPVTFWQGLADLLAKTITAQFDSTFDPATWSGHQNRRMEHPQKKPRQNLALLKKTWKALDKIWLKAVDVPFFFRKKSRCISRWKHQISPESIFSLRRALGPNEPCSGSARSCRESPGAPREGPGDWKICLFWKWRILYPLVI